MQITSCRLPAVPPAFLAPLCNLRSFALRQDKVSKTARSSPAPCLVLVRLGVDVPASHLGAVQVLLTHWIRSSAFRLPPQQHAHVLCFDFATCSDLWATPSGDSTLAQMPDRRPALLGSRQVVTEAAGPKGRFFDRPAGDKKESKRFDQSETKKKKGLYVPLDKKVGCRTLLINKHFSCCTHS